MPILTGRYSKISASILIMSCISHNALAYIGPGVVVVGVWALLTPIAAIIALVMIIAYYPIRYFFKKHKYKKHKKSKKERFFVEIDTTSKEKKQ